MSSDIGRRLRVLLLEDNPADAEMVLYELQRAGIDAETVRVIAREDFEARLDPCPDAILSDYQLPLWDGLQALRLVRGRGLDVPFIVVSGTIDEDLAVEAMRHGADDYLLKDRLSRLAPALTQALERQRLRVEANKAVEELRRREAGLRQAQELAKLAHAVTRPDGSFESWSETLPALLAMEATQVPKSTREWLTLLAPEDRAVFREKSIAAAQLRTRVDIEYRLRRGNGAWIHVRHVIDPLEEQPDAAGRTRWFNTVQDLTEQKRAEENLRESELRFRQVAENISEVFYLMNASGTEILYVSPIFERVWGRKLESLYAEPESWMHAIHADDQPRILAAYGTALQAGEFDFEYRIVRPDGSLRWIQDRGYPVRDADDQLQRIAGIAEDITDRKAAEARVRRLNRVYAVLSGINALIVRARTRDELFREACRIAVDAGQFRLAWIGVVDRDAGRVQPVAWSGGDEEYIQSMPLDLEKAGADGRGLAGLVISERREIISSDMAQDPRILLKEEAAARGFRSIAMLPLLISGEAAGVLALYAGEAGFFDDEEMKLLLELAGDIAFAMEHLEVLGKVEYLAFHDTLTGLPNRAVLADRLGQMLSAARRDRQLAGVMFFDVERLRLVNDTLGRAAGDELLKTIAERFREAMRAEDTLARVGGDVFAVAMGNFSSVTDTIRLFSDRLAAGFAAPMVVNGQELRAALKGGVAVFPNDGDTAEILCSNAEAALNRAKASGERLVFYTPELNARVAESLALENKLRRALEGEQFVLHYQPKVDTRTRALVGLEALIRWNDPELGLVPPGKFIPLMEETGIILQAGRWALGRAVADIQAWRGRRLAPPRVAVNVSQIQLRQKDFVQTVQQALEGFGDAKPLLDLEITESMVMQNFDATVRALQTLRGVGVETSLDDFGTGYSSLAYVARLPVSALKIDRSFIIEMTASKYARTIVQTVISLAHSLGLKVIAEGVEHEDQVAILAELGCDQMQGYLISKPVPPEQIEAILQTA